MGRFIVFSIVVRFEFPDHDPAALFDQLTSQVLPGIRDHEPGTLLYLTHTVEDAPLSRVFYEVYRNRDAHAAHEARPEVAAFLQRVREITSSLRVEFLRPDSSAYLPE
jgi:quinol monooxygenase YgiN